MNFSPAPYFERLNLALAQHWNRFWFAPSGSRELGWIRIGVGATCAASLLAYWPDVDRWFTPEGMQPIDFIRDLFPYQQTVLDGMSLGMVRTALVVAIGLALLLATGIGGRVTAIGCWLAALSFFQRTPLTNGPFEAVAPWLLAYLCVGCAGTASSLQKLLPGSRGGRAQPTPGNTIALRLIQVHLALVMLMMAIAQLSAPGGVWLSGEGMALAASTPIGPPGWIDSEWLTGRPRLVAAWSHLVTLYLLAFPVLAWRPLLAPLLLGVGAIVWTSIAIATGQLLFAVAMWSAGLAFLGPQAE